MFASNANAQNLSWPQAIINVENLLEQYLQRSDELLKEVDTFYAESGLTPLMYAGNYYPNFYYQDHQCAILGRMLGRSEYISHLEKEIPPLTASLEEVWSAAQSLDTWVYTAQRLFELEEGERAQIWNLECVGKRGIAIDAFDERGQDNTFMSVEGSYIWIYGDIVKGFSDKLIRALDANPDVKTVGIGSAGGSIKDAIVSGVEIRQRGLNTQLSGPCYSACPLVFIGGNRRSVMRPFPEFGFHQVYTESGPVSPADEVYLIISDYSNAMGVDGAWIVFQMLQAPPSDMNYFGDEIFERDELCRRKIVTGFQGFGSTVC